MLVFHLTLRAKATPDGYFGRITGVAGVAGQLTSGLSMVWLGVVLQFAPGRTAFTVLAAATLTLAAAAALAPQPPLPLPTAHHAPRQQPTTPPVSRPPRPPPTADISHSPSVTIDACCRKAAPIAQKGITSGPRRAAMIAKTFFLAKDPHRIATPILRDNQIFRDHGPILPIPS